MNYKCTSDVVIKGYRLTEGDKIVISDDRQLYNATTSVDLRNVDYSDVLPYLKEETAYVAPESKLDTFEKITNEMHELYLKKNHDYGNSFSKSLDDWGLQVSAIRLEDKMNRLKSLIKNGSFKVKDETIRDTLIDMANYSIMTLMYLDNGNI
jgi:anti-sigma28 factor (negative regulator of flagellin synthesis)